MDPITPWGAFNLSINLLIDKVLQRLAYAYYAVRDALR